MKSNRIFVLNLVSITISLGITHNQAHAWGQYGHEQINDAAITLLEEGTPFQKCLVQNRYVMKRYAITPDAEWKMEMPMNQLSAEDRTKRSDNDLYEHPLHFFEADAFVENPHVGSISGLPAGEYSSVFPYLESQLKDPQNVTVNKVTDHGTAPWRALQLYRLGVDAILKKDISLALLYLGTMGHYVGDISQPFHTTMNYDGQLSSPPEQGIHHEIDTGVLPDAGKNQDDVYATFDVTEKDVLAAANQELQKTGVKGLSENQMVAEMLKVVDSGYPYIDSFLKIYSGYEKIGNSRAPSGVSNTHFSHMSASLERQFSSQIDGAIYQRLGVSAALVARIWTEAYRAAGSPSFDGCTSQTFNQSYAIQQYPRPTLDWLDGYLPSGFTPHRH